MYMYVHEADNNFLIELLHNLNNINSVINQLIKLFVFLSNSLHFIFLS